jgi:transketolase
MLYLTGYGLDLDDIKQFRQFESRTPGHPERNHTAGVEVTTGPLGQGFANAVGIALAERHLRERFGADVVDHHTFGICSDGDLMEGISHEAASFAGHFALNRLIFVYDDNHITIDGQTELTYTDDVVARFLGYHWNVVQLGEIANDVDALEHALRDAMAVEDRPTLLVLRSHIGWPAPHVTDSEKAHGNPLGAEEIAAVKDILGMPQEDFWVPDDVLAFYREAGRRGRVVHDSWVQRRRTLGEQAPQKAEEFQACLEGRGLNGWQEKLPVWSPDAKGIATRVASQEVLSSIFDLVPGLFGGGADLTGNTGTKVKGARLIDPKDASGRLVPFGVREHGMGAIANGLAVSGTLPFVGTFFVFSDYMRPAVRLAALSNTKVAFVWSHDSIGLGEDGPTHQPIEQLVAIRAIPQLRVIRPADPNEVSAAWRVHLDNNGPTAILLTRQAVPVLAGTAERAMVGVARGAYVLVDGQGADPDLVLIGTGSEVSLCVDAAEMLRGDGLDVRVVSMPSWDLFEDQPEAYRTEVLPRGVPTLAVEAGVRFGWERYADDAVSIERFGASAPGKVVFEKFGYTAANVAARARALRDRGR